MLGESAAVKSSSSFGVEYLEPKPLRLSAEETLGIDCMIMCHELLTIIRTHLSNTGRRRDDDIWHLILAFDDF